MAKKKEDFIQQTPQGQALCWATLATQRSPRPCPAVKGSLSGKGVRHRPRWSQTFDKDSGSQGDPEEGKAEAWKVCMFLGARGNSYICNYLIIPSADVCEPGYSGEQTDEPSPVCLPRRAEDSSPMYLA